MVSYKSIPIVILFNRNNKEKAKKQHEFKSMLTYMTYKFTHPHYFVEKFTFEYNVLQAFINT